jgi:uncharacterized repeat protein (TIGR01451 family)
LSTHFTSIYSSALRVARASLVILVGLGLLVPTSALAHPPGVTEWVSVSSDGTGGNNQSDMPAISGDGRFVAFASLADNLVPDDTNGFADTFVHDRLTNDTERVSVSNRGREGNGHSGLAGVAAYPAISADGRFVAFASEADNLVSGDRNGLADIFVRDRQLGTTERVSVSSIGEEANGTSQGPALSADGRFVAFHSDAQNLVPGFDPLLFTDEVYVHDRESGTTEIVSINNAGEAANSLSFRADISGDGRFVVYSSFAENLVPGLQNGFHHVYLRDRATGTTERISEDAAGDPGDGTSILPKVSLDGRFVAFQTNSGNLIGDGNHESHILVKDRATGAFERVSATSTGEPADLLSEHPDITPDGRFVTFFSLATNLVPGDTNNRRDIFVRDRQTGTVVRVSVSTGEEGNSESQWPTISDDGLVVAFQSSASNLVEGANGGIFAHDDRPAADLSVTKSDSPDPVSRGAQLIYSIVVTNNGPGSAAGVQLTDTLPANMPFVSATSTAGSCSQSSGIVVCNLGDMSSSASVTVTIIVTPKKAGTLTNTAQVNSISPDPNAANNIDTEATTVVR